MSHPSARVRRWRLGAPSLLAAVALTAACGSTVQVSQQRSVGGGLAAQDGTSVGTGGTPEVSGSSAGAVGGGTSGTAVGTTGSAGQGTGIAGPAGPGSTSGSSTGASAPAAAGGGRKDPIQVGFVTTSVGNAAALGANAGSTYTDKSMFTALVTEYNLAGGFAGHKIVPVYGETDTASSNWANDFEAVCSKFTEDNKVKAVIGYLFVYLPSFESCLAKAGAAHLYGGYQPGDVSGQQQFPSLVATGHPTTDGFTLAALVGAEKAGLLTKKTKLGLMVDTCANGEAAHKRTTEPWLKARGYAYQTVLIDCARGASDVSAAASAVSSAELRFKSSGVDLVYAFGIGLIVFMQQAETQGYRPQYLTAVGGKAVADNAPAAQVKNLHGFGWMPSVDVDAAQAPYPATAPQKACLAKLAKHGLKPAAYNDYMAAYQACDGFELYARSLATQGSIAARDVVQGVLAALPSFQGAGTYNGGLQATAKQRGGPRVFREYGWTAGCSCLTYRGPTYPVPSP